MVARRERAEWTAEATVLTPDCVVHAVWGARDAGVLELVTRRAALQVGPADGGLRGTHIAAASVAPGPVDGHADAGGVGGGALSAGAGRRQGLLKPRDPRRDGRSIRAWLDADEHLAGQYNAPAGPEGREAGSAGAPPASRAREREPKGHAAPRSGGRPDGAPSRAGGAALYVGRGGPAWTIRRRGAVAGAAPTLRAC
jgi:hypothetical protein